MNKMYILMPAVFVMLLVSVAGVWAVNPAADNGLLKGKSMVKSLYLFEKDPSNWMIVPDGAWGKMTFNEKNNKFVFNGHMLEQDVEYSLVYYPDPWPGNGMMVLGEGTADMYGEVHIMGTFDFSLVPHHADANLENGAKIWLVTSDSISELSEQPHEGFTFYNMVKWTPSEYLFEYDLI